MTIFALRDDNVIFKQLSKSLRFINETQKLERCCKFTILMDLVENSKNSNYEKRGQRARQRKSLNSKSFIFLKR